MTSVRKRKIFEAKLFEKCDFQGYGKMCKKFIRDNYGI